MTEPEYRARRNEFPREILELALSDPVVHQCVERHAHGNGTIEQAYVALIITFSGFLFLTKKMATDAIAMQPIRIETSQDPFLMDFVQYVANAKEGVADEIQQRARRLVVERWKAGGGCGRKPVKPL